MAKKRLRKSPVEWEAFHNNPEWSEEPDQRATKQQLPPNLVNSSLVKIKENKEKKV